MKKIVIIGAGEQGKVVLDIIERGKKFKPIYFIDACENRDIWGNKVKGIEILGGLKALAEVRKEADYGIVAFGDNKERERLAKMAKELGFNLVNVIHPESIICDGVDLGEGVVVSANSYIGVDAKIGNNVIINTGAVVEHDNVIEDNVHIAPRACLAGGVRVKRYTLIGIGATVIDDLTIGENVVVAAGTVVTKNIPDNVLVAGVPGRIRRKK